MLPQCKGSVGSLYKTDYWLERHIIFRQQWPTCAVSDTEQVNLSGLRGLILSKNLK